MKKAKKSRPKKKKAPPSASSKTGKWVFDRETGKLVKVSDRASVASKLGKSGGGSLPCGPGACASCPAKHGH